MERYWSGPFVWWASDIRFFCYRVACTVALYHTVTILTQKSHIVPVGLRWSVRSRTVVGWGAIERMMRRRDRERRLSRAPRLRSPRVRKATTAATSAKDSTLDLEAKDHHAAVVGGGKGMGEISRRAAPCSTFAASATCCSGTGAAALDRPAGSLCNHNKN